MISARVYWNGAGLWCYPKTADQTEMQYQMRNWYYFNWLCGDHIVEQHIHNLDVINWLKDAYPIRAEGMGGRQVRTETKYGEIYDHHAVEFEYADGSRMFSYCRHIPGCWDSVTEHVHGTKGTADISAGVIRANGESTWKYRGPGNNPYQTEHDDLFASIRAGSPLNEGEIGAFSTMTAIMGRMATYSGKMINWEDALNSKLSLAPAEYAWNASPPVPSIRRARPDAGRVGTSVNRSRKIVGCAAIVMLFAINSRVTAAPMASFTPQAQHEIVPDDARLETLWTEGEFTEGPAAAADGTIFFSDIGNRIYRFDPRTSAVSVYREDSGKANGLMFDPQGRLVACEGANGGRRRISITEADGTVRALAERYQGKRFNSPNDLAIDRRGFVYFSDPRYVGNEPRELDFEAVFIVDPAGAVRIATREVTRPNGILVSPDQNTVYLADNDGATTGNHHLLAFRIAAEGMLADKRTLFDFGPGHRGIDGMTLDAEGNIYATAGGGDEAGIYVFDPAGRPLAFIATLGSSTNCEFGVGADDHLLYITAANGPMADSAGKTPHGLYRIRLKKAGYHLPQAGKK